MNKLSPRQRLILHVFGFILGFALGAGVVFQVFFLSKVIPHGGI